MQFGEGIGVGKPIAWVQVRSLSHLLLLII